MNDNSRVPPDAADELLVAVNEWAQNPPPQTAFRVVTQALAERQMLRPRSRALCPAHDDHNPSLAITEGAGGVPLIHCFAGCTVDEVLAALGLDHPTIFRS